MMSLAITVLAFGHAGILASCSSTPPRYPESHARFERIVEAVSKLQQAYVSRDQEATKDLLLPLESLNTWEQGIQRDFQAYSDIALDLSIDRMIIDGDLISTHISWLGEWKETPEAQAIKARGHGTLHWSGNHVILLTGVEGDLPFGMADRQALS
ncbi:MAG: hypothetical protein NPIRA05_16350 [Nitrospirales bacterium]|nr:MAG: hypothetical protein NPIRA05_16350 [Nitrospirales bacterium]